MLGNSYGYNPPTIIKNFDCLKTVTLWAGWLGVVQATIWIGLTLVGILSYNCIIPITDFLTFGSLVRTIFFDLYFRGECTPDVYQNYDSTILQSVTTVLDSDQLIIWICVYLGVAVVWLLASVLLLTFLSKDEVKKTVGIIYAWIFVTCSICLMDAALGVIFGIDYGRFNYRAYDFNANSANAGAIDPNAAQLIAAMIASISLMIISFKGFILWIVNVALLIYLCILAIHIMKDNDSADTLFMPRKESDDILATRPPIHAFEEHKPQAYSNQAFVPDSRSTGTIELNQEAIARAARMSRDSTLQERRFRNIESFHQYPPPSANSSNRPTSDIDSIGSPMTPNVSLFPTADYSPPMQRANQNGILRNQQQY